MSDHEKYAYSSKYSCTHSCYSWVQIQSLPAELFHELDAPSYVMSGMRPSNSGFTFVYRMATQSILTSFTVHQTTKLPHLCINKHYTPQKLTRLFNKPHISSQLQRNLTLQSLILNSFFTEWFFFLRRWDSSLPMRDYKKRPIPLVRLWPYNVSFGL